MKPSRLTRRRFIGRAAALAAPIFIPASALGRAGRPAPSERIVMGCIGTGSKGKGNLEEFMRHKQVQVIAVCDVDAERRATARDLVEVEYAGETRSGNYQGCDEHHDFRDLLARDDIDAVSIAVPDHWHAIPVIRAAEAGKDMYSEKPLSLTIREGRLMSDAVQRAGVIFQTGSQQRSDRNFRFSCELVRNGRIGTVRTVRVGLPRSQSGQAWPEMPIPPGFDYDMWLGQAPWGPYTEQRCHYQFRWNLDYSGGNVTDWGAHHCDIAHWGMGTEHTGPLEVEGKGDFPREGLWNTATQFRFECLYENGVRMICSTEYPNGVRFEGDEGSVFVTRGDMDTDPPGLMGSRIGSLEINLYDSRDHYGNFLDCVRSRSAPIAPIEVAHRSISVAHLGNIAMRLKRKVRWNPEAERFNDDPEADRMLSRAMRAPWTL